MRHPSTLFRWLNSLLLLGLGVGSWLLMTVLSSQARPPDFPGGVLVIVGEATPAGNELHS